MTAFLAVGLLVYLGWLGLGSRLVTATERPAMGRAAAGTLMLAALLTLFTLRKAPVAAHLTLPVSLVLWPAALTVSLLSGLVMLLRGQWGRGWPLLGLPVAALLAVLILAPLRTAAGQPPF